MKKLLVGFIMVIMLITLTSCGNNTPRIAVLDVDLLLQKSHLAQELHNDLVELGTNLQQEYLEKEESLTDKEKQNELEKMDQEFMRNKKQMEQVLNGRINTIISQLAREKNLDVVVDKNSTYYGGIDITGEVIERLDEIAGEDDGGNGQGEK
ncbi:OmpH family outer membrane protein [Halothermothrix orenii]|uniref:Outer membrane chaperone Skp (OmpH) n=1 Tax=Halothermothrix orenii (strain H 168 / OCM 544 / DSM 9562) TaxID=373903 RepID=B8CYZ5_HALOH|nr:OmpH family outer membrane protein [Halothermothrix orenii]ACL70514.1 outer membrane chaperone Skp (OmpH) [Halothermothrix orenii H 168]